MKPYTIDFGGGLVLLNINSKGENMSAPSKTEISELDNPIWSKVNHRASTELCAGEGN